MSARPSRLRPRVSVAVAGLAAVTGLVGWAIYPAHSGVSLSEASVRQAYSPQVSASPSAQVRSSGTQAAPAGTAPARPTSSQTATSRTRTSSPQATAGMTNASTSAGLRVGVAAQSLWTFDRRVGRASMAAYYVRWGSQVRWLAHEIRATAASHAEPIFEFFPGTGGHTASQIAAGGGNAWLIQLGRMVAHVHKRIIVSFFPEMNGPWHWSWTHGPGSYIRAYRHVHDILARLDGSLITWSWQPSAMHNANPNPMPWFPGRRYVNIAAFDGYYYFQHDSFYAIFGKSIGMMRHIAPKLPIMVGETAAGPMYGRQAWEIRDLFAGIHKYGLIGLVWFNHSQHRAPYQFHQDWLLEDHPAALAAFRSCLRQYGPVAWLS